MTKSILYILSLVIALPALAQQNHYKQELQQLFYRIHQSSDPHNDVAINEDITRLFKSSCIAKTKQVMSTKHMSEATTKAVIIEMTNMCGCVASSKGFKTAVIDSALTLKTRSPENSKKANSLMRNAMLEARQKCKAIAH